MTTDPFRQILFNDGEELIPDDLNDLQSNITSRLTDEILHSLIGALSTGTVVDPEFGGQNGVDAVGTWAFCISPGSAYLRQGSANHKIQIAPGTLLQKIATIDGMTPAVLPFKFDGTTEFTLTNGDATLPRVDLLQMTLSLVNDTPTTRLLKTNPIKATIDLSAHTTHVDSVLRAKIAGFGGNSISISLQKRSSGTGVSYSETGNAISILYQDNVSTVADLESSITTNSTLLEIQSAGTPGNVLVDPADTFASTHLSGGVDPLIVSSPPINKCHRIQCVLSVKTGTPNATPQIPDPDTGACVVGSVLVGNGWTTAGNAPIMGMDTVAANNAVVHDQRMPVSVRAYVSDPSTYKLVSNWALSDHNSTVTAGNNSNELYIPCPVSHGRLVAFGLYHTFSAAIATIVLGQATVIPGSFVSRVSPAQLTTDGDDVYGLVLENSQLPSAGPTILRSATKHIGCPLWTNGRRMAAEKVRLSNAVSTPGDKLYLKIASGNIGTVIGPITFYVAEGL